MGRHPREQIFMPCMEVISYGIFDFGELKFAFLAYEFDL